MNKNSTLWQKGKDNVKATNSLMLILATASACVMSLPARGGLIVGGFETGGLTPWTASSGSPTITSVAANVHSGNYAAQITGEGALAQAVTIVAGQSYVLDFWAKDNGSHGNLLLKLGGVTENISNSSLSSAYQHFTFTLAPVNTTGGLGLHWTSGGNPHTTAWIDDVQLTPVPEPTTIFAGAGAVGLLLLGIGARPRRSNVLRIGK
jgi:hypothetical protein